MYLEDHLRADALVLEPLPDAYHGQLDDVGLAALDGRVDGVALGKASHGGVARRDVGQVATAAEESLGITLLACHLLRLLHILLHLGEGGEIAVDELAGLAVVDAHALCQAVGGDAVDDAEVGLLGLFALAVGDGVEVGFPYLGGRGAVDVLSFTEGLDHVCIVAEVRHDAQLYLTVVG